MLDLFLSVLGLVFLSPILLLTAVAIKVETRGPIFYRGLRVGICGTPFRIFKFRSMIADADKRGPSSTNASDPRLTKLGKFMRSIKLDELPQLINVALGEMSVVGPRPEVQRFVDLYTEGERRILSVRPGITDWASIRFHNEGEIIESSGIADADEAYIKLIRPEKLRLQLKYVDEHSLWIDIQIILQTIGKVIFR